MVGGLVELSVDEGRLYYRRSTRPRVALIALGGNRFAFDTDPSQRLDFQVADVAATAFDLGGVGGPPQARYTRTP
jgi:hypothetical protein